MRETDGGLMRVVQCRMVVPSISKASCCLGCLYQVLISTARAFSRASSTVLTSHVPLEHGNTTSC